MLGEMTPHWHCRIRYGGGDDDTITGLEKDAVKNR